MMLLMSLGSCTKVLHLHLALTDDPTSMRVSWVTGGASQAPAVSVRLLPLDPDEPRASWQVSSHVCFAGCRCCRWRAHQDPDLFLLCVFGTRVGVATPCWLCCIGGTGEVAPEDKFRHDGTTKFCRWT